MSQFSNHDSRAFRIDAEPDPRELWEMCAVQDFRSAVGDLLRAGFPESDLAALIEESLPMAEEIADATAVAPPF